MVNLNPLSFRTHGQPHAVKEQQPDLHSQKKAPRLNQIQDGSSRVRLANSLVKAGSKLTSAFRASQRKVDKNEQRDWHEPLMRPPRDRSENGLQMVNSSAAHAITQKLNAEGKYTDVRALLAHETGTDVRGYLMRDQDNHYHQVQQSAALISTLKSSMPMKWRPDPAGRGHQAESTGIYTDRHNRQFTLHGRTVYAFDKNTQRWVPDQPSQDDISRLSLDLNGDLKRYRHKDDVRDHSATQTHEANLMRNGKVQLAEKTYQGKRCEALLRKANGEPIDVKRVGLLPATNGRATLFVLDKDDGLYHLHMPKELEPKDEFKLQRVKLHFDQAVGAEAADKAAVEGFIADGGTLKAVIRDGMGLRHSTRLHQPRVIPDAEEVQARIEPGWRISKQLHLLNNNGLPDRINASDTQIRLHNGAALGLNKAGELCGWNETTQQWDKLHTHGVSDLVLGLDDKPYVIHKHAPKALDVSFAQPKLKLGNEEPVALGRSTSAELGSTLSEEPVSHCAVLDDKHFALLTRPDSTAPAALKASLDGLSVNIPAPRDANGRPLPINSLALDQAKHLYASAGGNLYRLPHDQWTQSQHGETAAWTPAGLQAGSAGKTAPTSAQALESIAEEPSQAPTDVLKDQIKAVLAKQPGMALSEAELSRARVTIGKVEMGPNKRPVFEARLQSPRLQPSGQETPLAREARVGLASGSGATNTNTAKNRPSVSTHTLELSYDRLGAISLRPAKAQSNPAANTQWEMMQARNHRTGKIGNANSSSTTTMLGSTTDNARVSSGNIFKNANEAFHRMGDSYQHHFHPVETHRAKAQDLKRAYQSGDKAKDRFKNALNHIATSGARSRAGLNPLYQESQRLYESFDNPTAMIGKPPLDPRIDKLKTGSQPQGRAGEEKAQLHKQIKALRESVEDSSYQAIVRLGQIHELLDERGVALKPVTRMPNANGGTVSVLSRALNGSGLDNDNKARAKLRELVNMGLKLPDRRLEPSLDNTGRNKSPSSLLEDRILLDAQLLHQMADLLSRNPNDETVRGGRDDAGKKTGASSALDQLQGLRMAYENSDIKLFSDNGVVSHTELEKLQEARDTVARELTGKHGLKYNTTRSFSADMHAIGDHFGNLKAGDATSLLRSKGATFTTPSLIVPLTPDGGGIYVNFGGGREHGISLETEGGESATTLGLKNSHSTNGFLNVGYYHAPSAVAHRLFGSGPTDNPSRISSLYSADVSAKATYTHAIAGWLTASNASMANIMENLLDPSASLSDLYRLGQDKGGSVEESELFQQTLGAGASVDIGRLNLGGTLLRSEDGGVWNAFLRATLGVNAEATLLNNSKTSVTTHKGEGKDAIATKRARDVLPGASVGAYSRIGGATNGIVHPDGYANNMGVKNHILVGQTVLTDAFSVSFAIDRAKNDKFTLNFKPGKAVTTPQLHDVEKALTKVLKDKEVAQAVSERQALLNGLEGCAPAPVNVPPTLTPGPLGSFSSPTVSTRQRPAATRLDELKTLLPRLKEGLPRQADRVTELKNAVDALPAQPTEAQRDAVLAQARQLAVDMKANTKADDTTVLQEKATKAIAAGQKLEKAEMEGHLAALQRVVKQLEHLPLENEALKELAYTVQQLDKNNELSKSGGRLLASGEHKYTATGVQLNKGGLTGASAPWRDRTSGKNADEIVRFINKHPVLQEMARRAENEGPTSMELVLELKPGTLEHLEAGLNAGDPDIQKKLEAALRDDENIRIKSMTVLRSATQSDGKATPSLLLSAKSSAAVNSTVVLASLDFKYSHDQEHKPVSVTPGGLLVMPWVKKDVRDDLAQQSIKIRSSNNRKNLHSAPAEPGESAMEHASGSANTGSGPRGTGAL